MTPEQFCYWLQGYLELSEKPTLSAKQVEMVQKHLALVLTNVTKDTKAPDFSQIFKGVSPTGGERLC